MKLLTFAFAALLTTSPLYPVLAQQTTSPAVGADNTKESSAVSKGASAKVPGATGKAVVAGSNSTVAGDRRATAEEKTGSSSGTDGGK
jgi:hypothetical protein